MSINFILRNYFYVGSQQASITPDANVEHQKINSVS